MLLVQGWISQEIWLSMCLVSAVLGSQGIGGGQIYSRHLFSFGGLKRQSQMNENVWVQRRTWRKYWMPKGEVCGNWSALCVFVFYLNAWYLENRFQHVTVPESSYSIVITDDLVNLKAHKKHSKSSQSKTFS